MHFCQKKRSSVECFVGQRPEPTGRSETILICYRHQIHVYCHCRSNLSCALTIVFGPKILGVILQSIVQCTGSFWKCTQKHLLSCKPYFASFFVVRIMSWGNTGKSNKPCRFWNNGNGHCRYGKRCKFSHNNNNNGNNNGNNSSGFGLFDDDNRNNGNNNSWGSSNAFGSNNNNAFGSNNNNNNNNSSSWGSFGSSGNNGGFGTFGSSFNGNNLGFGGQNNNTIPSWLNPNNSNANSNGFDAFGAGGSGLVNGNRPTTDQEKERYAIAFRELYTKCNLPDKIKNIESLINKYGTTISNLHATYIKACDKYKVPQQFRLKMESNNSGFGFNNNNNNNSVSSWGSFGSSGNQQNQQNPQNQQTQSGNQNQNQNQSSNLWGNSNGFGSSGGQNNGNNSGNNSWNSGNNGNQSAFGNVSGGFGGSAFGGSGSASSGSGQGSGNVSDAVLKGIMRVSGPFSSNNNQPGHVDVKLTAKEIEAYKADRFTIGNLPLNPPTPDLA